MSAVAMLTTGRQSGGSSKAAMGSPDLMILYSNDAEEWDRYLTECFVHTMQPHAICIEHEQIENVTPQSSQKLRSFTVAKAILVILSPDFLDYVDNHAEVYELGKLLKPANTIAMLCGVEEVDVTRIHKAALVSYDSWPRLVAKHQDKDFVLSVINTTMEVLQRAEDAQRMRKPQFKLSPRKVREGNGKVFVILNKPIGETQKIQILLEGDGVKEVPSKWRNPYTLQFVVPDSCMLVSRILNIHVLCDDMLFGVRQLKCESKIGELYALLSSVNSPYEFLCRTMGVASLHEVDEELVKRFQRNMPAVGFSLLDSTHEAVSKRKSEEEIPTLLHFAARYGLQELTSQLLQCPNGAEAARLRNVQGMTPAQLANHAGHNEIAAMLDDYQNLCNVSEAESKPDLDDFYETMSNNLNDIYKVPLSIPVNALKRSDSENSNSSSEYLKMSSFRKNSCKSCTSRHRHLPMQLTTQSIHGPQFHQGEILSEESCSTMSKPEDDGDCSNKREREGSVPQITEDFCGSQTELIAILEEFKKGASITDVEGMFHEWQKKHSNSDNATQLEELRQMYKQSQGASHQKKKMSKKQHFSFSELRNYFSQKLNIRDSSPLSKMPANEKTDVPTPLLAEQAMFRPISVVSTASVGSSSSSSSTDRFSTFSAASSCDSGNHSDSCDEGHRLKESHREPRYDPKALYLVPPARVLRVQQGFDKPPAPPPRPAFRTSFTLPPSKDKMPDHGYYKYPPAPTDSQQSHAASPEYVGPDPDTYISASQVDAAVQALDKQTSESSTVPKSDDDRQPTEGSSMQEDQEHYQRPPPRPICISSACKLKATKSSRGIQKPPKYQHVMQQLQKADGGSASYDLVPMPPVPVGRSALSGKLGLGMPGVADYDIPRPLYQVPRGSKKPQHKYL